MLSSSGASTDYVTHQGTVVSLAHTKNCDATTGTTTCTMTASSAWDASKGAGGYHGLVVGEYNSFHKGAVKDTSASPQVPDVSAVFHQELAAMASTTITRPALCAHRAAC